MLTRKMHRMLSMTSIFIASLYLAGLGGCASLSKEDRALLESSKQSAAEAKAIGQKLEGTATRLEDSANRAEMAATKAMNAAERAEAAAQKTERIFDKSLKK